ncbi:MAG: peptidylprolyl isomerase [Bacteroidota bacterium]
MTISKHKVVTVHYTLRDGGKDGVMLEETLDGNPLSFIFGIGQMIPGFEGKLENLVTGDSFAFLLSPEEAYGGQKPNAIVDIPKSNFADSDGTLNQEVIAVGQSVRMKNQQGQSFQGTIIEDKGDTLVVDFNHPMAGKHLHFNGTIVNVREATMEERTHGYIQSDTHQ